MPLNLQSLVVSLPRFLLCARDRSLQFSTFQDSDSNNGVPKSYGYGFRPGLVQFLEGMLPLYEIHVYTKATGGYARCVSDDITQMRFHVRAVLYLAFHVVYNTNPVQTHSQYGTSAASYLCAHFSWILPQYLPPLLCGAHTHSELHSF